MKRYKKLFAAVDMTEGTPWRKLLLFTVPLLIGNLFQQVYSTADAIILGQFVGDHALAAVGSTMSLIFLIFVLMMGVSIGTGIMVSQYFGAKKREELSYTIGNGITIITIVGLILMLAGPIISRPILILLNTPAEILDDAIMYTSILFWGILTMAYFNVLSGILRGLGEALAPLIYLIVACLLNIILNIIFIVGFGWGVPAVALGTVLAQGLSSILCLRRLLKMTEVFDMGKFYLRLKKQYASQIMKLGVPTGASQAVIALSLMVVQPLINDFGPLTIAAYVIVMRIDGFVMMPNFSYGNAMTVFTGQNMGAGKIDRVTQGTKQCALLSVGTAVIIVAIILIFGRAVTGIFTSTPEVINLSQRMLLIMAPGYIIFAAAMVFQGTIRGAGDAIRPLWIAIFNSVIIRVPAAYIAVYLFPVPEAIIFSMVASWTSNMILSYVVYRRGKWRDKGIVKMGA